MPNDKSRQKSRLPPEGSRRRQKSLQPAPELSGIPTLTMGRATVVDESLPSTCGRRLPLREVRFDLLAMPSAGLPRTSESEPAPVRACGWLRTAGRAGVARLGRLRAQEHPLIFSASPAAEHVRELWGAARVRGIGGLLRAQLADRLREAFRRARQLHLIDLDVGEISERDAEPPPQFGIRRQV